nr:hypothetical protein [Vitiosangium sp. GDMCC 1.1324]
MKCPDTVQIVHRGVRERQVLEPTLPKFDRGVPRVALLREETHLLGGLNPDELRGSRRATLQMVQSTSGPAPDIDDDTILGLEDKGLVRAAGVLAPE